MKKILLINDEAYYRKIVSELLIIDGYDVKTLDNPIDAIDEVKKNKYDLIITDLIVETIDGMQLFSILRKINVTIPIIVLTNHISDNNELKALNSDVADYINRPVSMEVLFKRIEKVLKTEIVMSDVITSYKDGLVFNVKQKKVFKDDQYIKLTAKEYDLLLFLMSNANNIFTREEILNRVWHTSDGFVDARTVDTHIKKLRQKLNLVSINSVRGIGYEWFE